MKISDWFEKKKREYKHANAQRFLYNNPGDVRRKIGAIRVWYLLHSQEHGAFIFDVVYKRTKPKKTVKEWAEFLQDKTDPTGGYFIFTQKILDAINTRRGLDYILKDILAWSANDAISKPVHSKKRTKRDQAERPGTK